MAAKVSVNERNLHHPITGVQRYTQEITQRLSDKEGITPIKILSEGIPGQFWEQMILPRYVGHSGILWSPANTGPLTVRNQVVTIHDLSPLDHPEWFNPVFAAWYRYLLPRLARKVKLIISDSQFSKERIVERLKVQEEKVSIIPCGVAQNFQPSSEFEIGKIREKYVLPLYYLLSVGSLQPRKNLKLLFDAWKTVNKRTVNIELIVVGISHRVFSNSGYQSVPAGVKLLGFVKDDDLPSLYSGSLGFVYPSLYEGFGLPVLEAMACGTPVIASRLAPLTKLVGDAGILVDPKDPSSLADVMIDLVSDEKLREKLSIRGLARAEEYSWDITAKRVWEILQKAAD